jgi:hypothetical protein
MLTPEDWATAAMCSGNPPWRGVGRKGFGPGYTNLMADIPREREGFDGFDGVLPIRTGAVYSVLLAGTGMSSFVSSKLGWWYGESRDYLFWPGSRVFNFLSNTLLLILLRTCLVAIMGMRLLEKVFDINIGQSESESHDEQQIEDEDQDLIHYQKRGIVPL